MRAKLKQSGLSAISLLLVLVIGAFLMLFAFKVVPVYAENYYITTGLKTLAEDNPDLAKMSTTQIKSAMNRYYSINNVRSEGAKQIDVIRNARNVLVVNEYESRVPLIHNIDLVLSFKNVLDSDRPDECCKAAEY
ncbi:DUF4845 domain-containing protein [uncultured Gilvimarinus sp.]|uniref:DUF4845 domain-containing protein n=1 Tax=uncultured Gilvimarinus sp. TaxID=1689143 RepID=UPI0030EDD066|tara:strand:+ start:614 stop:1018 length:405 start_codon:yes stop_codon:yes gene_type:complete